MHGHTSKPQRMKFSRRGKTTRNRRKDRKKELRRGTHTHEKADGTTREQNRLLHVLTDRRKMYALNGGFRLLSKSVRSYFSCTMSKQT
mmetsp:Transcript_5455/g.10803  ORF Transcript_5455/g.10803 Transcript_5455/m.10803 type:complete len:88 (+) Transcript_5455:813-1076(+)